MSVTHIPAAVRRLVRHRARECCEYCLIPESVCLLSHAVDHVIAEKHGGPAEEANLALSCAVCNARKGSDLASFHWPSGEIIPLFHPRQDRWQDHFRLDSGRIEALTAIGQVTARLLHFNDAARVQEREVILAAGLLNPPTD